MLRVLITITAVACLTASCADGESQPSPTDSANPSLSSPSVSQTSTGEASASYSTEEVTLGALNPRTARFKAWVTNNGDSVSESPRCLVAVHDPSGRYTGRRAFTMEPIAGGDRVLLVGNVPVAHQGAEFVTEWEITCH